MAQVSLPPDHFLQLPTCCPLPQSLSLCSRLNPLTSPHFSLSPSRLFPTSLMNFTPRFFPPSFTLSQSFTPSSSPWMLWVPAVAQPGRKQRQKKRRKTHTQVTGWFPLPLIVQTINTLPASSPLSLTPYTSLSFCFLPLLIEVPSSSHPAPSQRIQVYFEHFASGCNTFKNVRTLKPTKWSLVFRCRTHTRTRSI